ncbi:RING finger domain-containing protein [Calycina marina]|uniref:RING finger domain-containing protein n=1 Tax=Calycina marina TaxID=1763456 RepID=A0A9P7ZA99_9HELO|nr:RING finger domain-containing protein [Calycina marina]
MATPYGNSASWSWPEEPTKPEKPTDLPIKQENEQEYPSPVEKNLPGSRGETDWIELKPEDAIEAGPQAQSTPRQRHYVPRTCRICLEIVQPTFENIDSPSMFRPAPKVQYISSDPADGRLIRPCKCKGSSRYVHEGCLQAWRHADPGRRNNYWQCPTCKFKYQLVRMRWSSYIQSTVVQVGLTMAIMVGTIFMLGFIADPLINLWLDPYDTIASLPSEGIPRIHLNHDEGDGWLFHFAKGLASLGLVGMAKAFFIVSPWTWINLRSSGLLGGSGRSRRVGTGRERLENISWTLVLVGFITFLIATWKFVRNWCRRTLEVASDKVLDVQGDDVGDGEEEEETVREDVPTGTEDTTNTSTEAPDEATRRTAP